MTDHRADTESTAELSHLLGQPTLAAKERDRLADLLYPELKRLAEGHMRRERPDHTLQATALVSEVYLRLCRSPTMGIGGRHSFLGAASRAMRRLLVDHARAKRRDKRGGAADHVSLDDVQIAADVYVLEVLNLDTLLNALAAEQPRLAEIVELRFFGGLTNGEIGNLLGIHERTVKRDWQVARAWLHSRLEKRD